MATASSRAAELTEQVDAHSTRWAPTVLRWTAALLWLANVNWKVPPDFGRSGDRCVALCRYVEAGVDHPVVVGAPWFFEQLVSPNLTAFGWLTIFIESTLVVLLVSGRFVRSAAVLGIVQSLAIGVAVANAPDEWYWAYILMAALHVAILVTTPTERPQTARTMAAVTAGYGVVVAIVRGGAGFGGSGNWVLFSQDNGFPGEWGRGSFPGSIAIGLFFIVLGVAGWFVADKVDQGARRTVGWVLVAVSVALVLTYDGDLIVGLGSRPGNACILAALGLALAVVPRSADPSPRGPDAPAVSATADSEST